MQEFILPLQKLIEQFRKLPSVGSKSAIRYALDVLKWSDEEVKAFADAVVGAKRDVHACKICHAMSEDSICPICQDPERDATKICVVEEQQDVLAMERVCSARWVYHVLGGVLNPRKSIGVSSLNIQDLFDRVQKGGIQEVILATNSTFEGDTTAQYIASKLAAYPVRVTKLAYGIPAGGSVEYADEITLDHAIAGRILLSETKEQ